MGKRDILIVLLLATLFQDRLTAQNGKFAVQTEHGSGKAYPLKQAVLPWTPSPVANILREKATGGYDPSPLPPFANQGNVESSEKSASTNSFIVNVGRNFEGNHLTGGTPSDNTMAISNNGIIVSVDNYSIGYFKENGDTIAQFGLPLTTLYNDTTLDRGLFDPRVIYDSYEDRFILVSLFYSFSHIDARMIVSFSKPLVADTVEWTHYNIDCDSVFTAGEEAMYWFDYPNIAVSKSQFIVASVVTDYDSNANSNTEVSNVILQIDKSSGYNAAPSLTYDKWKNTQNADGRKNIVLVPANSALQLESYDTTIYLVSNYGDNSSKFFWFELVGAVGSPTSQITGHSNFPAFFYQVPSYASQLGGFGRDRIAVMDCDIQYCLLQNNKLHFVFTRSNTDWAELVYANIDITTNTFTHSEFDGVANSENFLRPSIACYGVDSTDENYLIGFLRTGPNQFPEICAVNYDSTGWSIVATSVKMGHGILDLRSDLVAPWDSMERLGDYTCIQRRYNDPFRRCWMVGAHSFGLTANHFGILSGVNAWIAELGDSLPALGSPVQVLVGQFQIFPNPANQTDFITVGLPSQERGRIEVSNSLGQQMREFSFSGESAQLDLTGLKGGMYFVTVFVNGKSYETKKLIVRD